jgi:YD repeat-containing protein
MIYDPDDHPTEMQVRGADGQLVTRIVRTYDAEGRLTEERILEKNMPTPFLKWVSAEQQAELTPAQLKA